MSRQPRVESVVVVFSEQAGEHQPAGVRDPAPQRHAALAQALEGAVGRSLTRCTWIPGTPGISGLRRAIGTASGTLITYVAGGLYRTESGLLALRALRGPGEQARPAQTITLHGLSQAVIQASARHKLQILDLRAGLDTWSSIAADPRLLCPPSANTAAIGHLRLTDLPSHSLGHSYTWTELLTCVLRDGIRGGGPVMSLGELADSLPLARSLSRDRSAFVLYEGDWPPFLNPDSKQPGADLLERR